MSGQAARTGPGIAPGFIDAETTRQAIAKPEPRPEDDAPRGMRVSSFAAALGLLALSLTLAGPVMSRPDELLIDDFGRTDGRSALGAEWRFFADTVMGGVSRGRAEQGVVAERPAIRLTGRVSIENNGGFIQVALPLGEAGRPFDAGAWTGIRIEARGAGGRYDLHLRNTTTRLPWQYYRAGFTVTEEWATIDLPFAAFEPAALSARLDPTRLTRIGLVAAGRAFDADLAVARVSFYR